MASTDTSSRAVDVGSCHLLTAGGPNSDTHSDPPPTSTHACSSVCRAGSGTASRGSNDDASICVTSSRDVLTDHRELAPSPPRLPVASKRPEVSTSPVEGSIREIVPSSWPVDEHVVAGDLDLTGVSTHVDDVGDLVRGRVDLHERVRHYRRRAVAATRGKHGANAGYRERDRRRSQPRAGVARTNGALRPSAPSEGRSHAGVPRPRPDRGAPADRGP